MDRLSESGFAGFLGILRMASACWIGNGCMSVVCVFTRDDESPRVYECWTDCLNQDLPDFWGFSGWRVPAGSGMVVCALYACSLEITRVHERFRVLDRLSESGFAGFLGILRMASACWIGNGRMSVVCVFTRDDQSTRAFTSVYERWTDCLNQDLPDFWGFSGWRVPPGSGMVV